MWAYIIGLHGPSTDYHSNLHEQQESRVKLLFNQWDSPLSCISKLRLHERRGKYMPHSLKPIEAWSENSWFVETVTGVLIISCRSFFSFFAASYLVYVQFMWVVQRGEETWTRQRLFFLVFLHVVVGEYAFCQVYLYDSICTVCHSVEQFIITSTHISHIHVHCFQPIAQHAAKRTGQLCSGPVNPPRWKWSMSSLKDNHMGFFCVKLSIIFICLVLTCLQHS